MNYMAEGLTAYQISRKYNIDSLPFKRYTKQKLSKLVLKLKQPLVERTVSHRVYVLGTT